MAGAWMLAVALFNIGVQLSAPRWVAGRSLAAFQASIAGGIAMGSWGWGHLADIAGVEIALLVSAGLMLLSPLLGIWLRMPPVGARNEDATEMLADPEVRLSLTGRSGPLVIEIEYRVAQDSARAFHNVMQEVQLAASATAPMAGRSRATSPTRNYGPSATTARPGWIICGSATAPTQSSAC